MLLYCLEVSLCWLVFFGFYWILLRKDTFFEVQRSYLLGSLVLGFLIPTLVLFPSNVWRNGLFTIFLEEITVTATTTIDAAPVTPNYNINWLLVIYLLITSVLLFRFAWGLFQIICLVRKSEISKRKSYLLVNTKEEHAPFSFFKLLFINNALIAEEEERRQIMRHEEAHIEGWHSLDVILLEFLTILFWFNPLLFLYRNALRIVHEYLADAEVLKTTPTAKYGRMLLSQAFPGIRLANNFNHSQLQKRINMMTKAKSTRISLLKYVTIFPLVLLMMIFFSCQETVDSTVKLEKTKEIKEETPTESIIVDDSEVFNFVQEMPRFAGCEDITGDDDKRKTCAEKKMLEFIYKNIQYPKDAREKGIEGMIVLNFIVEKDGSITNTKVLRSLEGGLKEEGLRVVNSMPKWIPGKQDGETVRVKFNLPIRFKLQE